MKSMWQFDISLTIQTGDDGLDVTIDFWQSRIDQRMAESASECFRRALTSIVSSEGDQKLGEIDIVPSWEIEQIREWNKTLPSPVECRIHDLVYEQQLLRPDAMAVQGWDGNLTYRELDQVANRLASYLGSLLPDGFVQPETKIALCFEKSIWAVVSQLAVLKSGGCVVPLGTKQPMQRIGMILRDIEATVLLTTEKFAARFEGMLPHVIVVDEALISRLPQLTSPPACAATPENSAFIIYTSGSTGVPKGVVLPHSSLCSSLQHLAVKFKLGHHTRMVQFSAYTFDISIQDIYCTWHYGGCLIIISEKDRVDNLGPAMAACSVNCAGLTSTVAGMVSPEQVPTLETLVLLGEAVKPAVVDRWIPHVNVFNAYGPSECSIQASCRQLTPKCNALNIGHALASALWVADPNDYNRLVPLGAPGELLIEGPLQAREYLNNREKTDAAFITDPSWVSRYFDADFGTARRRRFYRTGDWVHQDPVDGSITYIGRRDTQIKVRGQRVEVGEIEHHLIQQDGVLDAAVVFPREGPCQDRLVGLITFHEFFVPCNDTEGKPRGGKPGVNTIVAVPEEKLALAKLRTAGVSHHLAANVPEHMVPKLWIPLVGMMPQNDSGKLDRKTLGQWVEAIDPSFFAAITADSVSPGRDGGDSSPEGHQEREPTSLERQIQTAWAEVLNLAVTQVPIARRSFLSFGGDSITAMQVISRCRARGIDSLGVRDILRSKSIEELALKAGVVGHDGPKPPLVQCDNDHQGEEESAEPFPLLPVQQWYFEAIAPRKPDNTEESFQGVGGDYRYNQSVCLAVRHQPLVHHSIDSAIRDIVSKHPMLRARFSRVGNEWRQSIVGAGNSEEDSASNSSPYQFGIHDVQSHDEVEALIATAQAGLDLERGPVFSAQLIHLNGGQDKKQLLFLVAHHLVIDLVSWRIILRDLDLILRSGVNASSMPSGVNGHLSFKTWTRKVQAKFVATSQRLLQMTAKRVDVSTTDHFARSLLPFETPAANLDYWGLAPATDGKNNNLYGDQVAELVTLDETHTALLFGAANDALRTEPVEVMLAALFYSFRQTFPDRAMPTVFYEGHGRDAFQEYSSSIDASDTVGWFTTMAPIYVSATGGEQPVDFLKRIKDTKRSTPGRGLPYFVSRFSTPEGRTAFSTHGEMEVLFNYAGRFQQLENVDSLFEFETTLCKYDGPAAISPIGSCNRRPAVFGIEVSVAENTLQVSFQFHRYMRHKHKVLDWCRAYATSLRNIVTELAIAASPMFTLSDFPLLASAGATYESLERLHAKVMPEAGLAPGDIEDIYPCSPIQQGILMSQAKAPSEYMIQTMFEIQPAVNSLKTRVSAERVIKAWLILVDRHPMLRTVFVPSVVCAEAAGGYGLFDQVVLKSVMAEGEHKHLDDDNVESRLGLAVDATSFDMSTRLRNGSKKKQPSHKFTVFSTPSGRVYVRIIISHALVDASSLMLLQKELVQAYDGKLDAANGTGPAYSAYVSYLQRTPAQEALKYWTKQLADAQPCYLPPLTTSGFPETPTLSSAKRAMVHLALETTELDNMRDLKRFSEIHGVTIANLFQLAWALVLSRFTGSTDVSFGYVASGRDVAVGGVDEMIGPLINMMVTRIKLDGDGAAKKVNSSSDSVNEVLERVQADFFDGFNHQRASLLDIWHALRLEGRGLFNTSLSYRHASAASTATKQGGGGQQASVTLKHITSQDPTEYDANLHVVVSDNAKVSVALQYSPNFMSRAGAKRLVDCLVHTARSLTETRLKAPLTLSEIDIATQDDVRQLCAWNESKTSEADDDQSCIHDLVHQQRLFQPDAPAVCAWDGDLTYRELEDLANQLARHLIADLGVVGPEAMVALCFDKSRWAVVAQLAVLKAGGVVVSINAKHPMQRVAGIIIDVGARVMLTTRQHLSRFSNSLELAHIVAADDSPSGFFANPPKPTATALPATPAVVVKPENAAFVIYTSGSTGVPKGVVLTHSSLRASFAAHGKVYGMNSRTRSLQFASYTFDASISDIFGTLSHGGCVCVISEMERMNNLEAAMNSYRVNLAQLTPTVASLLDSSTLTSLDTLVLGGEAVKPALIEGLLKNGSRALKILNGYGPSECSIYTTCSKPLQLTNQTLNIGRVLVGGVWVVNDHGTAICPIGAVGELWIEGPLLASGYLNDKANTDSSFIVDPPWAAKVGLKGRRRFYRTGDLVRQNAAGEIIYIGRGDTQVKIRGQRVDMGEVEDKVKKALEAIAETVAVKNVAVSLVIPGGNARNPMLAVAVELVSGGNNDSPLGPDYVTSVEDSTHTEGQPLPLPMSNSLREAFAQLHSTLSEALPLYMVPRLFIPLSHLPFTTSGKLDRRSLCQLLESLPEQEIFQYGLLSASKVSPVTDTERELQQLWAAVLDVELDRVGIHDHFLHSGGDSVTAMRLVSMANSSKVSLPLTVADIFRHPKLVDMANFVDQRQLTNAAQGGHQKGNAAEAEGIAPFSLWKEIQPQPHSDEKPAGRDAIPCDRASLMTEELSQLASQCGVFVEAIEDVYPCTPLQEGLMAITAQQPHAYVGRWVYRMPPTIDCQRFKDAWNKLSTVSPILCTRIVPGRLSGALQVVVRGGLIWSSGDDLQSYLADDAERLFAYGSPLVRPAIVTSTNNHEERYFVLTAHHSAYDGWSLAKLFDAISMLYNSSLRDLPDAPPYTRFIRYVEEQKDSAAAKEFWGSQLDGDDDDVGKPFSKLPNPSYKPQPSRTMTYQLLVGPVKKTCITLAAMLRAAWALVISKHSGSSNVLLAVPLSGRAAPVQGMLDLLAPTITTVPVRIRVNDATSVHEYVTAVQQQAVDMMPFEHTGVQQIRRLGRKGHDIHHLFAVQPAKEREFHHRQTPGARFLGLEPMAVPMQFFDGYALTVECITGLAGEDVDADDRDAITIEARFDENIVSSAELRRLFDRFRDVLSQLMEEAGNGENADEKNGTRLLGSIDMLSTEEVALLAKWNGDVPDKNQALLHELVAQHATTRPDAPAVCAWDGNLTHGELDRLSGQLAHHLVSLGVGPEVMVPLCFDKSKWVVVSILAVLKAGGAVVPIRADPMQRAEAILRDTSALAVLTTPHYASLFQDKVQTVLPVDHHFFSALQVPLEQVGQSPCPSNAAFVIYTSGSTGVPKGVVIEHASMATSMQSHGAKFGMTPETRAFQFSHFTFDISLHDMLTTLQFGGCVCMPSEEERMNDLAGAIRRMAVNYTFLPPRILPTIHPSDIPGVRTLIVGGEAMQAEHAKPWVRQVRVFHAYGPAECCIVSTCNEMTSIDQAPNIGRAVAGGLWVVDELDYNRLLPIGVVGELLIEGPLLARGYLNDAEKTAAAFVSDPAWLTQYNQLSSDKDPSRCRRMYRTGDLVRQNDDGSLTYIGRRDNQIKIRGQRVEIGEVEHHLTRQAAVLDAAILYPRHGPAQSRLVGLLTLLDFSSDVVDGAEVQPTASDQAPGVLAQVDLVRQRLLESVPEYMVPSIWISLAFMPQNSSNKVDRKKLLQYLENMDAGGLESIALFGAVSETPEAPASDLKRQLQTVLAEVLNLPLEKIGLNRSFLSMGGDSITAMQVVSRCRTRHGISILVRDVLQARSVAQLTLKATVPKTAEALPPSDPNLATLEASQFDLSPIQQLYFDSMAARGLQAEDENRFNQSICLVTQRRIDTGELERAAEVVVQHHAMLRARFQKTGQGVWKQRVETSVKGSFRLGIHRVQTRDDAEAIISSAQRHLDLEDGPVFSIDCIDVAVDSRQLLFLTAHHLVVDPTSWRIIVDDLDDLIQQQKRSGIVTKRSKSTSFQRWTQLLSQRSQEEQSGLSPAKAHPIETIETPVTDWAYWGMTRENNVFGDCTRESLVLEEGDTALLLSENQPLRTEPIEVLLAALFHSFHQAFPSRPTPTVFNEEHSRELWADSIDLSGTVGWLTTLAPIHVPVADDNGDGLIDVLRRTKDARRGILKRGLACPESPFLNPAVRKTSASHGHAQVEVAFNYTGQDRQQNSGDAAGSLFRVERGRLNNQAHLSDIGLNVKQLAVFEFEASVCEGKLVVNLCFNPKIRNHDAVQKWLQSYLPTLKQLLKRLPTLPPTLTLSDFPSIGVTYDELSRLQAELLPQAGITNLADVEDICPCSHMQQGILLSQMKDRTTYQVQQLCEIQSLGGDQTAQIDLERLSRAWEGVVRRHAILRTVFVQSGSGSDLFYQVVLKQWKPRTHRIPGDNFSNIDHVVSAFAGEGRPDYARGQPPHQVTFCTATTRQTYIQLDVSHALMDASSLDIVLHDLIRAYDGLLPGYPAPSYGTYVSYLRQTSADKSLDYWTGQLSNAQPCCLPPSAAPAAATKTTMAEGSSQKSVEIELDNLESLHRFRDAHGITVANIMQLAWALLLARYTGSSDVIFGCLANGRDVPISGVEEMAGPMINMMVSRVRLGPKGVTVAQVARQVQEDSLQALNHQRTSLGSIQHALRLSEQGLFNTTVSYVNRRSVDHAPGSAGLALKGITGEDPTEYDVNLKIAAGDDAIWLSLQYSSSYLDEESARCMLDSLRNAVISITQTAGDDEATLEHLDPVTASDIERIRLWNAKIPDTIQAHVQDQVYRQSQLRPDAQAISSWDGHLTYAELNELANSLACHLTGLGAEDKGEFMVGLCFEKSAWALVAMMAILKAGGVVVPLGSQLPPQRLQLLLDDSRASVVLTSRRCEEKFRDMPRSPPHILTIDETMITKLREAAVRHPSPHSCVPVSESAPAVIIYTSGSTGLPKGVVLTHASLCTVLDRLATRLDMGTGTRALQFSAYVFDVSLLDILATLRSGGCVCVVSEEDRMDTKNLAAEMEAMGVNFAALTPTVAALIDPESVPTLRTLALAGEALQPAVVETWSPYVEIFNLYGPAECTVVTTVHGPFKDKERSSNVGTPVASVAWVVDQDDYNCLVPIGAVGELLVEGPALAREYLHDPTKTAAAFITNPAFISKYGLGSPQPGVVRRMYRTGDLVRQSPVDGSISYISRKDSQIKIRGQRVEVAEIEYWVRRTFSQAQTVAAALVMPRVRNGEPILAVVVEQQRRKNQPNGVNGSGVPSPSSEVQPFLPLTDSLRRSFLELQAALTEALPSYMVPAIFVPFYQIPLTASGKVNRMSLKTLLEDLDEEQLSQYALAETAAGSEEAATATERQLQLLWTRAINAVGQTVATSAHFFRSGGDSVTAMRLVALARSADPPISLSVADVFKNPILKNMAEAIDRKSANDNTAVKTGIQADLDAAPFSLLSIPGGVKSPGIDDLARLASQCENVAPDAIEDAYPCTPLQEGLLVITTRQEQAYVGRWIFGLDESIDIDHFKKVWQRVSDAAAILRTRIITDRSSGNALQVVVREQISWLTASSDPESYVLQDAAEPMGFGTRLVRFAILTTPTGRFFVWTVHHSIYDGWTARKLLGAASNLYSDQTAPELEFAPYSRFIRYLHQTSLTSDVVKEYWQSQLKGSKGSTFPAMPQNHQPQPSSNTSRRMNIISTRGTITSAAILRAAWALVVSQETENQDVVFAAPLSGRMAPVAGILNVIGPTVATVPVRIRVDRDQKLLDYMSAVHQQAADMIPFEHTGLKNISQLCPDSTPTLHHLFVIQPSADRVDRGGSSFPGLELVPSKTDSFYSFPLVVQCSTVAGDQKSQYIEVDAWFDETVLPAAKMQNLLERFEHLFSELQIEASSGDAETKNRLVGEIDMLSPRDMARIREWNTWSQLTSPKADACVHELVHQQQLDQPESPAVCAWDGNLSYAQLENLASRLAYHLVNLGVGPETAVVHVFEKSKWAIVAQLATLKAGGVVVPVNHQHPTRRIQGIIEATGASIILTSSSSDRYSRLASHALIVDQQLLAQLPDRNKPVREVVRPTNAAFIIFTSGSTGIPKGVVLEHGAVVTSLQAHGPLYGAGRSTRTLQFSAYTFDVSIAEIFTTLVFGGCVCVVSEEERVSNLAAAMDAARVNFSFLTPTVASLLNPPDIPTLETLVFLGERLEPEVLESWIDDGHVRLFNAYGPAECTILATFSRPITDKSQGPNIGTALAGGNLWVVHPSGHQLVPIGSAGELLIEGSLLARGYLGDEEKTSQAFVTDPAWLRRFDSKPASGRRLYRTGDLVRQNQDGSLVYLGRRDTQVKIHGQRVETGEIEYWVKQKLGRMQVVAAGLITPAESDSTNPQVPESILAVALEIDAADAMTEKEEKERTPTNPASLSLLPLSDNLRQEFNQLRSSLFDALPAYMVPQLYVPIRKLPLTDSGKLDRKLVWTAIQQSDAWSQYSLIGDMEPKVLPSTDTERKLQQLWAELLRIPIEQIGAQDDFFRSGGDSISAMRLVSKIRGGWQILLTVADIFRHPVLSDLAAVADTKNSGRNGISQACYEPFSTLSPIAKPAEFAKQSIGPLLSTQGTIVDAAPTTDFQALSVVLTLRKSRDMLGYVKLDGNGICDTARWEESFRELVRLHEILRTAYVLHPTHGLLQTVLKEYQPHTAFYQTDMGIDDFSTQLITQDMHCPPSLGRPFVAFAIINSTSTKRHQILFRTSHADYDGISMSYFLDTLKSIYDGVTPAAYPPFTQYMSVLTSHNKEEARRYWSGLLKGSSMPQISASPQHGRPFKLIHHATRRAALVETPREGITTPSLIRAAWALVLAQHVGSADVVFGEVVSGRNTGDPVAERAAGCCANIVPVRVKLCDDSWTARDLLSSLHQQHLARLPYETLGFRETLQSCAGMPPSTHFTSRINCLDRAPRWAMQIGGTEYQAKITLPEGSEDLSSVAITSVSKPDHVEIAFGYQEGVVSPRLADELLDRMCSTVELLARGPQDTPLRSVLEGLWGRRDEQMDMKDSGLNGVNGVHKVNGVNGVNGANGANGVNGVNGTPSRNVDVVSLGAPKGVDGSVFKFEGDMVDAGYKAFALQQKGMEVTTDDVLCRAL